MGVMGNEYLRQDLEYILIALDRLSREKIEELMKPETMLDREKNSTIFCLELGEKHKTLHMRYDEGDENYAINIEITEHSNGRREYEYIYNIPNGAYIEGKFDLKEDLVSELQFVIMNAEKPKPEDEIIYWGEHR